MCFRGNRDWNLHVSPHPQWSILNYRKSTREQALPKVWLYSQDFLCMCYFTNFWSSLQCQEWSKCCFKKNMYTHTHTHTYTGFPGGTGGKGPTCQCREHKRHKFNPWVQKTPWRRAWQPTPAFLPGEALHGQRSLVGCSPWGHKEISFPGRM